ncbi:NADP+-dependent malic enzyme, partial [Emiliania huxleyi CCMP1516]|uniref:Malic enzyme NAD-binding domain-containing protein n=2 Tax=Emiliania huxleyi TaxID=2903 RepID=A0A0D3K009_EMIH1
RPIVFALSNPKTQAEITAADCYAFSEGKAAAIFGSGTRFDAVEMNGKILEPGQVNNFFIFPGMSFGAWSCGARSIPESFFMVAAEAVANGLDAHDIEVESVVPHPSRIRSIAEGVAKAVVLAAQEKGLATK